MSSSKMLLPWDVDEASDKLVAFLRELADGPDVSQRILRFWVYDFISKVCKLNRDWSFERNLATLADCAAYFCFVFPASVDRSYLRVSREMKGWVTSQIKCFHTDLRRLLYTDCMSDQEEDKTETEEEETEEEEELEFDSEFDSEEEEEIED